jgi:hypothetical protein
MRRTILFISICCLTAFALVSEASARCRDARMTCRFVIKCRTVNTVIPKEIDQGIAQNSGDAIGAALNECANFGHVPNSVVDQGTGRHFDDFAASCDNFVQIAQSVGDCNKLPQ